MVISTKPFHNFQITMSSEATEEYDEDEHVERLEVILDITYTASYPDEGPVYKVIPNEFIGESHVEQLNTTIAEQIEENLGMAMVFTLVSTVQEFLNERVDDIKKEREEEKDRVEEVARLVEEERTNKLKGTPVTIETFLAWKERFDEEMAATKKDKNQRDKGKGLTGSAGIDLTLPPNPVKYIPRKELFFQDSNLDTSDMALLDEGDLVEVDESLFQEMDDLDLDEDLDDLS